MSVYYKGEKVAGSGQDGFSPIVSVSDIDGGHRVTITDKEGEKAFDVMDGDSNVLDGVTVRYLSSPEYSALDSETKLSTKYLWIVELYEAIEGGGGLGGEEELPDPEIPISISEEGDVVVGDDDGAILLDDNRYVLYFAGVQLTDNSNANQSQGSSSVPTGVIVIWSGTTDNIPAGWQLCDGTNGAPDLRDKFVLGAGESHVVGDEGGSEEVTLTVDQMPSHTHEYNRRAIRSMAAASGSGTNSLTVGDSVATTATGGSQPHSNMPPYYTLCYIMKT